MNPQSEMINRWANEINQGRENFYEGPPMGHEAMGSMNRWQEGMIDKFRAEAEAQFPGQVDEMEDILVSIINGDSEQRQASSWDDVVTAMLDVADVADESGRYEEADRIADLIHKASVVKVAQYEGGQNYWLLNQRAFERAWRIKRQKAGLTQTAPTTPEQFKSAQECWLEVLEEYQDALLGNDAEMLSKYAAVEDKEAKKKKPKPSTETAAEMSENMTAFHDQMDEDAKSEGVSSGEFIAKKFGPKGAAMGKEFLVKVSERLMDGSSPGVAFYEAMDHFTSGQYARDIVSSVLEKAKRLAFVLDEVDEEIKVPSKDAPREEKINQFEEQLLSLKNAISVLEDELKKISPKHMGLASDFKLPSAEKSNDPIPSMGFDS